MTELTQPDPETHSSSPNSVRTEPSSTLTWAVLLIALVIPTLITLVYFQWLHGGGSFVQQAAYGIGKLIQFGLPIGWVWWFERERLRWNRDSNSGESRPGFSWSEMGLGVAFGLLVVASLFGFYFFWLQGSDTGNRIVEKVLEKADSVAILSLWMFLAVSCFYSLIHSFLEEYYWRWFAFDLWQRHLGNTLIANLISSLGFAAHHVIVLGFFCGWDSPYTYLASALIAVGGSVWAWMYQQRRSILVPWVSHMIVDAGIFGLGFWILKDNLLG